MLPHADWLYLAWSQPRMLRDRWALVRRRIVVCGQRCLRQVHAPHLHADAQLRFCRRSKAAERWCRGLFTASTTGLIRTSRAPLWGKKTSNGAVMLYLPLARYKACTTTGTHHCHSTTNICSRQPSLTRTSYTFQARPASASCARMAWRNNQPQQAPAPHLGPARVHGMQRAHVHAVGAQPQPRALAGRRRGRRAHDLVQRRIALAGARLLGSRVWGQGLGLASTPVAPCVAAVHATPRSCNAAACKAL